MKKKFTSTTETFVCKPLITFLVSLLFAACGVVGTSSKIDSSFHPGTSGPAPAAPPLTCISAYVTTVLADSPIGYWRLNETSGTVAKDSSGFGRDMTFSGGYTLGTAGAMDPIDTSKSVTFNGIDGQASIPIFNNQVVNVTITSLVHITNQATAYAVFTNAGDGGNGYGYGVGGGNHSASALFEFVRFIGSAIVFSAGWHHAAFVLDAASNPTLYVDGIAINGLGGAGPTAPTGSFHIGGYAGVRYFDDAIQDVAFYPTALAVARIQAQNAARTQAAICH